MILPGASRPLVIAHRGSSGEMPENTMAAFRGAADTGADMIELDVRLTLDGEFVVFHDRRLGRTARGRVPVRTLTLREIQSLDAGSWFGRAFRGERVPSLRDVMRWLPSGLGLNVEVKTDGDSRRGAVLEDQLLRLIRESGKKKSILVSSFDHRFLRRLRQLDSSVMTGALTMPFRDARWRASAIAHRAGASVYICSRAQLRRRFVRDAHQTGIAVACYDVNTLQHYARVWKAEIDAVITNYPRQMLRARTEGQIAL